ncbi:MAG: phosphatase PAP2 family protein [Polyangiaceae bacterium]|nr:phosphatase PAP2 family protein [Polyangiaceae bacterium]
MVPSRTDGAHPWARALREVAQAFALHDLVILAYQVGMYGLVLGAGSGEAERRCARWLFASWSVLIVACVIGRLDTGLSSRVRTGMYRLVVAGTIVGSYLMLRDILPLVQPRALDEQLLRLDIALFGVEPTVWLEPYTTPSIVEYFAFFYFSYFGLLAIYALVVLGLGLAKDAIGEFAIGGALVFCVGQLGYVVVPGYGPIHHLSPVFAGPLEGGFFWRTVLATVESASAMKDIFPSLHTAAPVWLAGFAIRRALLSRSRLWTLAAVVTTFFAINIVISTIVLRWHYVIDVIAGLALAFGAIWAAPRLAGWERSTRARHGLAAAW